MAVPDVLDPERGETTLAHEEVGATSEHHADLPNRHDLVGEDPRGKRGIALRTSRRC
jgi:hypothetical protein